MAGRSFEPGPAAVGRTLLALAAIGPGLLAGLASLAIGGDRRRAWNRAIGLWGRLGTAAAGIRLEVQGARHLERRPAVFLINHQSGVDPILVCALLRRDFVGMAKRELRRNPLLGPAMAFAGTLFVDRATPGGSAEPLERAVATLHAGLAVAVAPEGTRSPGHSIGRFRRGAFHLARAARVPVVPIVIHNAADVLPRGAWLMTPATVRVQVLAPIATDDWEAGNLDARVAAVEALYREALAAGLRS